MRKLLFALVLLLLLSLNSNAQKLKDINLEKRISLIEDRIAIKNVVDTFSILADTKEVDKEVLLFTENATVETVMNGKPGSPLTGRKQIRDSFTAFLSSFELVYHINGQQTVTINTDKAEGISYCQVTLIGNQNGKKIKTTFGVRYNDDFVREAGKWLIAKRKSTFLWKDIAPMDQ